jgi:hypothetical protein
LPPLLAKHLADVVVRTRDQGVDRQRALDQRDAMVMILLLMADTPGEVQRLRVLRLQREHLREARLGRIEPPGLVMCDCSSQNLLEIGVRHKKSC